MQQRTKETLAFPYVSADRAKAKFYKRGAVVTFASSTLRDMEAEPVEHKRGVIRDQSTVSRKRCAHAFGNAKCRWVAMLCLTWHHMPPAAIVKEAWTDFRKAMLERFGESPDAWVMEMQERGAPHFHLFIAREGIVGQLVLAAIGAGAYEDVAAESKRGNGRARRIIRTEWVKWIGRAWIECSAQDYTLDAEWWHCERGIVEVVDNEDAAGRYMAKESSKREQKILPDHYSNGLGRWWFLARRWKPEHWAEGDIELQKTWPWDVPVKYVWAGKDIAQCITNLTVIPTWEGKATSAVSALAAQTWDTASSQEKQDYRKRDDLLRERGEWEREAMAGEEICDTMGDDGFTCRAWRKFDSEIRSMVCPKCGTIRMASRSEVECMSNCTQPIDIHACSEARAGAESRA